MKKYILSFFILVLSLLLFLRTGSAIAATSPTDTPTPTESADLKALVEKQVENLKDKIASEVAKNKLSEKRGVLGTVTDRTNTQITLTDINGQTREVDVDDLTKFSSPNSTSKSNFGISDITKGMKVGVLGLYNKETGRILARFVDVTVFPVTIRGAINNIDSKNFNYYVITDDNKKILIDIENTSKISSYTKEDGLTKEGFKAATIGENVVVFGYMDKSDSSKLITSRIILFPDIPKNPKIQLQNTTANLSPTPPTNK